MDVGQPYDVGNDESRGLERSNGSFLPSHSPRHVSCAYVALLVRVWVILDRPPNDPLLRKEETFTSS